jgi:AcrR family transcriptional regulator
VLRFISSRLTLIAIMPYPHKIDERRILEEVARVVDEDGLGGLSTRNLAERLGVKAPSLYRYFPDKRDLVHSISVRFATDLALQLTSCETLRQIAEGHWEYARQYPRRYEVMTRLLLDGLTESSVQATGQIDEPFLRVAARLVPDDPIVAAWIIRSFVLGAIMRRLSLPALSREEEERAFELGLQTLEWGLTHAKVELVGR